MRTFDIRALDKLFIQISYDFLIRGGTCKEEFVLDVSGDLGLLSAPTYQALENLQGWIFDRPYRLTLVNAEMRHGVQYDGNMRLRYLAIPIVEDLRHPVLVHRKREVTYAAGRRRR